MPLSIKVNLRVTGHCNQGGRKYMEDMFSVAYQQTSDDKDLEYAFFGIFDGHGGGEAATFAKEHLMDIIVKQRNFWSDKDEDVLRAIRDGYVNTHYAMWRELDKWPRTASGLPSTAGTTASVAFIRKGKIYIGHVGDSGIILGYQDEGDPQWKAKPLTKDHKPESNPEKTRIEDAGGKVVTKSGVPRVVWNRPRIGHKGPVRRSTHIDEIPFLAVARSLGDLWSYNSELDTFVVSPEPDVKVVTVDVKSHRCLIFGTDGLWNMLTPQGAVAIVQSAERHNEKHLIASQQTGNGQADLHMWINPSKSLVDKALDRWSTTRLRADNTSVVTLMLDPPGPSRSEVIMNRKSTENLPTPKSVPTLPVTDAAPPKPFDSQWVKHTLYPPTTAASTFEEPQDSKFDLPPQSSPLPQNNVPKPILETSPLQSTTLNPKPNDSKTDFPTLSPPPNPSSIQVAEISSSDSSDESNAPHITANIPTEIIEAEPTPSLPQKPEENPVLPSTCTPSDPKSIPDSSPQNPLATPEEFPLTEKSEENSTEVVRQNAFYATCEDSKRPRLRRSLPVTTEATAESTAIIPSRRQSQGSPLTAHLESRSMRRRQSLNAPTTCIPDRQKSYFAPVNSRLKQINRDRTTETINVRKNSQTSSNPATESIVGSKRRHSSTSEPPEEAICTSQEPSAKRRTRSEDRPVPIDENDPANKEEQRHQHSRLRWPEASASGATSRSRSNSSCIPSSVGNLSGQEKISSPNSFQRRSLEKKATPVKTFRRPSINGTNRSQLRGSFALRDWEQKSSHHNSCDRARLNRSIGAVITGADSSSAPSLQRWLRSDTLAATPVKTLRSRNVDIAGHTVPAQIAHQYGIVKPNRLSLPAKLKIGGKVVKTPLAAGKLTRQNTPGNSVSGTGNGSGSSGSGITRRVKSPYNPSARSALGTRSRLKRLGK